MVENIKVSNISPYELQLDWDAPASGCLPDKYIAEYKLQNQDQCLPMYGNMRVQVRNVTNTSGTLSNLKPYSTYMIYVTGLNSAGNSTTAMSIWTTPEAGETSFVM